MDWTNREHGDITYTQFLSCLSPWSRIILKKLIVRSTKQIPRLLWNPKVHEFPPEAPIMSQMNQIHTDKTCVPKIHFNIILPHTFRSS
jgi:hypothetical protein